MHDWAESLLPLERDLFLWLNSFHTPFWDTFMWIYSGKLIWIPLVLVCLFSFCFKMKWREALLLVLGAVLVGVVCDQLSSSLIKPMFERLRPGRHPDFEGLVTFVNGYMGGRYGFVSGHAANGFGVVVFSSLLFRYRYFTFTIFLWALLTCYSRIYLGVHFVTDVLGGMVVGALGGFLVYYIYIFARRRWLKISAEDAKKPILAHNCAQWLMITIAATVLFIVIYSFVSPMQGPFFR